jgi:uncharacterized protein (UPF0254 family)
VIDTLRIPYPVSDGKGAEMAALIRKYQQILMAAIFAFHMGKAVVQIAAIQIPINNLLKIRPPESVLP